MKTQCLTNTDKNKRFSSVRAESSSSVQKHVCHHRIPFQANANNDNSGLNISSHRLLATREYRRQAIIRWKLKMGKPLHEIRTFVSLTKKDYRRIAIGRWKNKKARQEEKLRLMRTNVERLSQCLDAGSHGRRQRSALQHIPLAADLLPVVTNCRYCHAIKFYSETSNFCCLDGRIVLSCNELPLIMQNLLTSTSEEARTFRTYIRTYNNLFAFTSLGVRADPEFSKRNRGVYTFRVQGQVYHFINDLLPQNDSPKNLQLYFHDTDNEIQNRLDACPRLSEDIIRLCITYLESNPYARFFRNLRDVPNLVDYKIVLKTVAGQDQRVYNKPDVSQVAALWVEGEENGENGERHIEVRLHSSQSQSIEYYFACYDPLQYPLMFPFGELGWHQRIPKKAIIDIEEMSNPLSTASRLLSCDNFTTADQLLAREKNDHFVWKADKRSWSPRQTGDSVGRIVIAHPSEGERYYLRILLSKICCPKSYADLKVFNGTRVNTFREAALLRGYLLDDNSQHLCLEEASTYHMPYELRRLLATLLVYTAPNNPRRLWEAFEDKLLEDFVTCNNLTRRQARKSAFQQLNVFLQSMGKNLQEFDILPQDFTCVDFEDETIEIRAERNIVVSEEDMLSMGKLNTRQKIAFDTIIARVNSNKGGAFFIDGPGGTGKTFLYRALLAKIRSNGDIALATATSGIAASLLPGGRTAHSRFKIPIDLAEGALCRVSKQSSLATLIKNSKLIIWDEAPMAKRSSIECLDNLLQDLLDSPEIFGGKVVVLGGDFRQTLPVVRKGNKSETIAACLINSPLWPLLHQLQLQENMRALLDPCFTDFLLRLGSGNESSQDITLVTLPESMVIEDSSTSDNLNVLIRSVYPDMFSKSASIPSSLNRAILTTKNSFVDEINDLLIGRFAGEQTEYNSFDETIDPNDQTQYEDLLHSLTPNGMPPHRLVLKVNSPVILLRNMNPTEGLCNGTRLFCKSFSRNVIRAEISFGDFAGKEVFIHRIPLLLPTVFRFPTIIDGRSLSVGMMDVLSRSAL